MMDKSNNTAPNAQTGAAAADAIEQATQPVLRPWQKPFFEHIPLNEALSGGNPGSDGVEGAS
jgi:hypothetical protein